MAKRDSNEILINVVKAAAIALFVYLIIKIILQAL